MRRLALLLALLLPAPAHAAPRALLRNPESAALAGDTLLFARGGTVFAQPLGGGPPTRVHAFAVPKGAEPRIDLAASPQRAAIAFALDDDTGDFAYTQALAGPPTGPFQALTPLVRREPGAVMPWINQVAGETVFTTELRGGLDDAGVVARDPSPHDIPLPGALAAYTASFAGDLVAFGDDRRLVVQKWRTATPSGVFDLPEPITRTAVSPGGRAAAITDEDELYLGRRHLASGVDGLAFAGETLVYRAGNRIRAVEPSGRVRPFGIPTKDLNAIATSGTRVLWWANGCLLLADVTEPRARAIPEGPCPRSEILLNEHDEYALERALPVEVDCISAPRACRGSARLLYGIDRVHAAGPRTRFVIPAGRTRAIRLRLSPKAYRHIRHVARHERGTSLFVDLRTDDGDRPPGNYSQTVTVRE
jgi:hypothetical protein